MHHEEGGADDTHSGCHKEIQLDNPRVSAKGRGVGKVVPGDLLRKEQLTCLHGLHDSRLYFPRFLLVVVKNGWKVLNGKFQEQTICKF